MSNKILYKGIDISKHNGKINFSLIPKDINFIIIRAGFGLSTIDPCFKYNIENAIVNKFHIGIYWFSYAGTIDEVEQEALYCLKTIAPYKAHIDFPVFFDYEYDSVDYNSGRGVAVNKYSISDMAEAFFQIIKKAGYMVGNYSSPNFLQQYYTDMIKNKYDLWLAHVKDNAGNPLPGEKSSYMGPYTMHQYSWVGKVKGISGNVDMNYCYKDYLSAKQNKTEIATKYIVDYKNEQTSVVKEYSLKSQGESLLSPHFKIKEFKCKDGKTDIVKIDNRLIWLLEKLFDDLQCSQMIVNSGYRTPAYSVQIGGSANDRHTMGQAADIICYDKKGQIIPAKTVCCKLCNYGNVFGIGFISDTATHVDTRPKSALWWGDEKKNVSIIKAGYSSFDEYFNGKKKTILKINPGTWNIREAPDTKNGKVVCIVKANAQYEYTTINQNGWAYIPSLKGWLAKSGYTKVN